MQTIDYDIPLIKQGLQDCVQSNAVQILKYYGIQKSLDEVKAEVPVFVSKEGNPLGSSLGHIATYFINQGLKTTIHTVDIEIFDRSWKGLSNQDLIEKLQQRRKFIQSTKYSQEALDVIFDGYISFLKLGGQITFPIIDENFLINHLKSGPIYGVVSFNFLNSASKYKFSNVSKNSVPDSVEGSPGTHVVTIAGYKDNQFKLVDPDPEFGGIRWIDPNFLIGSIYLAETDFDSILITFNK
ncbi:MAG: hypothetical protein WC596_04025 [Candidatus Shapirobacteria bacterium]